MKITFINGDILHIQNVEAIVHIVNCLCTHSHGLSSQIAKQFPWSDIYAKRRSLLNRNLAVEEDRGKPGTIVRYSSPYYHTPDIICLLAQWDYGTAQNRRCRQIPPYKDSSRERSLWFEQCLNELGQMGVNSIAVPYKIGCGLGGQNWSEYLNILKQFSRRFDIEVLIVKKE